MGKIKHAEPHKYELVKLGQSSHVWRCALPHCNHYMPKHLEEMVPGKASLCWACGAEMTLNIENMKENHPRCDECRGIAVIEEVTVPISDAMQEFLSKRG